MGFNEAKRLFLEAFSSQRVVHEMRSSRDVKNWVSSGRISYEMGYEIISATRGSDSSKGPHHFDPSIELWTFKPTFQGRRWYIKGYLEGDEIRLVELRLLSFHPSEGDNNEH